MVNPYKIPSICEASTDSQRERAFRRLSDKALLDLKAQFRTQLRQVTAELDRRGGYLSIPERGAA